MFGCPDISEYMSARAKSLRLWVQHTVLLKLKSQDAVGTSGFAFLIFSMLKSRKLKRKIRRIMIAPKLKRKIINQRKNPKRNEVDYFEKIKYYRIV